MNKIQITLISILLVCFAGCSKDHLDPSQVGRFRPTPMVNVILDSLGVAEEESPIYEGAEDPRPVDIIAHEDDYVLGSGDVVRISIFELLQEGQPYVNDYVVTESGRISIPEVGVVQASGLTEAQLEEEIRQILSPGILKNPSVTAILLSSQSRVFTILGDGVSTPGRYFIPRYDYRLMDALAEAGSARQFNVSYIYVARRITGSQENLREVIRQPQAARPVNNTRQRQIVKLKSVEPQQTFGKAGLKGKILQQPVILTAEMTTAEELQDLAAPEGMEIKPAEESPVADTGEATVEDIMISQDQNLPADIVEQQPEELAISEELAVPEIPQQPQQNEQTADVDQTPQVADEQPVVEEPAIEPQQQEDEQQTRIEWVFEDGKWIPKQVGNGEAATVQEKPQIAEQQAEQPPQQELPAEFGFDDIGTAGIQARVIKIPADKLFGGDPRYNIVIKPGDTISVRLDVVGEFYVMGNVNNQGIIQLTGRPMTMKMAVAAAGGLGPLAWPKKCEVIRRIGEKKEEIVMVDLEKIANGSQPDFFIKPNDIINVGTHGLSRFMAVLRNAFRATYGFGFVYDRNFADRDFGDDSLPTSFSDVF